MFNKKGELHHNFGKHWKLSEESKEKISNNMKGRTIFWKDKIRKSITDMYKNKIAKFGFKIGCKHSHINTDKFSNEARIRRQNQILQNGGGPNIGKNEEQLLTEFELSNNLKLVRQYPISGYFVDGYCKKLNFVIEIDEEHHKKNKYKDKQRENNIIRKLDCSFIRINDNF